MKFEVRTLTPEGKQFIWAWNLTKKKALEIQKKLDEQGIENWIVRSK